jgi:hypothetical protein
MPIAQYVLDAVGLAGDLGRIPVPLPSIATPPCTTCQNFLPQVMADATGQFLTVLLCVAPHEQQPDFSCYDPRP